MKYLAAVILFIGLLPNGLGQSLFNLGTLLVLNENPNNYNESALKDLSKCTKDGCVGRVWIYYSDVATPTQWGTISQSGISIYARNITCRQLGYKESNDSRLPPALNFIDGPPVWITKVDCGVPPSEDPQYYDKNNILQCNPEICRPDIQNCRSHDDDLVISCNGVLHSSEYDYYNGEVFLCSPREKPFGMQTSMGLLQIAINKDIKGITIEDPTGYRDHFESSKRNSFCRQLGFTQAVTDSLYTERALSGIYSFSPYSCSRNSWYNATHLSDCSVDKSSSACFGCCFNYPPPGGCLPESCKSDNLIAIACVYDPHNEMDEVVSNGYRGKCELKDKKIQNHDAVCGTAIPDTTYIKIIGILAGLLFISLISSLILLALYIAFTVRNNGGCNRNCIAEFWCYWCRPHVQGNGNIGVQGYDELRGQNQVEDVPLQ